MTLARDAERRIGRIVAALARVMAWGGGLLLCALAVMTVVSIVGRRLADVGLGPVPGDYELVANGCALAVFSFLPHAQIARGHVTVDILAARFPARVHAALGLIGDLLVTLASAVILRQIWLGFSEKFPYGGDSLRAALGMASRPYYTETTYELQIPVWIPYGFAVLGAVMFLLASLYTVWRALNWVLAGREAAP